MKQKFELYKQNNVWSDSEDHDEVLQAWVVFTNEITTQIEECHGFPVNVYFNDIEVIECEVYGEVATVIEMDYIYEEICNLTLSNYKEL